MTDRYAVIGTPIAHTKSPQIHQAFAAATGQDLEYTAIEAPADGFAAALHALRRTGLRGLNVTVPFKLDACAHATELREPARLAGAANALLLEGEHVIADNFDGIGLVRDLTVNLDRPLRGRRVLLLGAGGSVRGALLPFLREAPSLLAVVHRRRPQAEALVRAVAPGRAAAFDYQDLLSQPPFDVVVNATSASLRGELPPLPPACFARACLAYELAYGKGLTPFLRLARDAGAGQVADGVGMLVEQAAEAFFWWRGVRPDTAAVIRRLTVPLT